MTNYLVALLIGLFVFVTSCNQEKQEVVFGVDLQHQFLNDSVAVSLDGEPLLNDEFTTTDVLGVCLPNGIFRTTCMTGKHLVEVRINGNTHKKQLFAIQRDFYLVVRYEPSIGNISLLPYEEPFLYD